MKQPIYPIVVIGFFMFLKLFFSLGGDLIKVKMKHERSNDLDQYDSETCNRKIDSKIIFQFDLINPAIIDSVLF